MDLTWSQVHAFRVQRHHLARRAPKKDLAKVVREYHIPDFSDWKDHDAFESAFGRLLADLKAEAAKTTLPPG